MTWINAYSNGVCTIETTAALTNSNRTNQWRPLTNYFTTNTSQGQLTVNSSNRFFRLLAVDVSTNTPMGASNLFKSYGLLHTIAGNGSGCTDGVNYWLPGYEGAYATNVALSRPHNVMADDAGDIFIVDKDSHSVLKVTADGRIHTVAGTHLAGNGSDATNHATNVSLYAPTGLWVHGNGSFHILDTGNGKIRRVDTNGMISTFLTVPGGILVGRGLWVEDDESDVYFCSGTTVKAWHSTNGFVTLNSSFVDLGNIHVTPTKENVVAADRGASQIWKVDTGGGNLGTRTLVYGDGHTHPVVDGTSALTNSLNGVRGIWKFPTDGYLLALHEGDQILYVDPMDNLHIMVDGYSGLHSGDGQWFHSPGYKVSQSRAVTMDSQGNILIVENDCGYVRKIDFQRLTP